MDRASINAPESKINKQPASIAVIAGCMVFLFSKPRKTVCSKICRLRKEEEKEQIRPIVEQLEAPKSFYIQI
jgi:hypothetical protein